MRLGASSDGQSVVGQHVHRVLQSSSPNHGVASEACPCGHAASAGRRRIEIAVAAEPVSSSRRRRSARDDGVDAEARLESDAHARLDEAQVIVGMRGLLGIDRFSQRQPMRGIAAGSRQARAR